MANKRTRNRQLAKQHQRRRSERMQHHRKRQTATIAVALVVALLGSLGVFLLFSSGDDTPPAASGATGETGVSGPTGETGATGATGAPGSQTGTVQPEPGPAEVACGGTQPEDALTPKPQFSAPGQVVKAGKTYEAVIQTSCGQIVVELLADEAPETVNSFVFLAEQGYFDGQRFHRLDPSLGIIQGGDPTGVGNGGPGYTIPDELTGEETYDIGVLAMGNTGAPDSGGSQFFFVTGDGAAVLSPDYTVFGRITEGLDVAQAIEALPVQESGPLGGPPAQAVYLEQVTIRESK